MDRGEERVSGCEDGAVKFIQSEEHLKRELKGCMGHHQMDQYMHYTSPRGQWGEGKNRGRKLIQRNNS